MDQDIIIDSNNNQLLIKRSITKKTFRGASFNRTAIVDERTRETVSRLIEKEFFDIPKEEYWRDGERDELIKAALNMGLIKLADKLTLFT